MRRSLTKPCVLTKLSGLTTLHSIKHVPSDTRERLDETARGRDALAVANLMGRSDLADGR